MDTNQASIIRELNRSYYDIQKVRIMHSNRLALMVRDGLVISEGKAEQNYELALDPLLEAEKMLQKHFAEFVRDLELWQSWLSLVRGIGPTLAAGLIAEIQDVGRFDTVSKLWAYLGLHVVQDEEQGMIAARRKRGQKANWSTWGKTTCWKISDSFVKQRGAYRDVYDTRKAYEAPGF